MTTQEQERKAFRDHMMAEGHDYKKCALCIGKLQAKGITTIRTIVHITKPEHDIIEYVADFAARL
jgi:hypothetical protein